MTAAILEPSAPPSPSFARADGRPVAWEVSRGLVPYEAAVARMEREVQFIANGEAPERVWLLEHPPLYTAGTSAEPSDLVDPHRLPVHRTGRGGRYTYHGPGQRIAYVMLDLAQRRRDVRAFVEALESWVTAALAELGVKGESRRDRVGVWVARPDRGPGTEDKIAAIGVRLRRWVSYHGISINVAPDLGNYAGIVPCGISDHGVTSLADLGIPATMADVDTALEHGFNAIFGPVSAR